jgi:hypothetical protein
VPGNWQARFWRPVKRGDPLAEFNRRIMGRAVFLPYSGPRVVSVSATYGSPEGASPSSSSSSPQGR